MADAASERAPLLGGAAAPDGPADEAAVRDAFTPRRTSELVEQVMGLVAKEITESFATLDDALEGEPAVGPEGAAEAVVASASGAAVYVSLCAMKRFQDRSHAPIETMPDAGAGWPPDLLWSRARFAELVAIAALEALIAKHGTREAILESLCALYPKEEEPAEAGASVARKLGDYEGENAILQGAQCGANKFVGQAAVTMAVDWIWSGTVCFAGSAAGPDGVVHPLYTPVLKSSDFGLSALASGNGRLRVPANGRFAARILLATFIGLYTYVLANRTETPGPAEWAMMLFALSYALAELGQIAQLGLGLYVADFWNDVDLVLWGTFIGCACIRIYSLLRPAPPGDPDDGTSPSDTYYDFLSFAAVPLWLRVLSAFSEIPFVATTLMTVRRVLRDTRLFLILLIPLCVGFSQALRGLDPKGKAGMGFWGVFFLLMRGFIGDLDFDAAQAFHPFWGPVFYGSFVAIGYIILGNLLVAIYWESYYAALADAGYRFRLQRILAALELGDLGTPRPFPPPFNLLELVLVKPAVLVFGRGGETWARAVWWVACAPVHLLVALKEEVVRPAVAAAAEGGPAAAKEADAAPAEEEEGKASPVAEFADRLVAALALDRAQADRLVALHDAEVAERKKEIAPAS
ncbi:hypothetical protein DFJ74DRAFT_716494 [Hyaloraphidium curvatum]|nr:hypothetical protein DFJ74DRAFT_716494 [Hyaloraphidium curvatum]